MRAIRRRTRETLRHERAVVLQQLGANACADPRPDWEANLRRADELRKFAIRAGYRKPEGGEQDAHQGLGVVTGKTLAGGKGTSASPKPCNYCGQPDPYHTADCPVIS